MRSGDLSILVSRHLAQSGRRFVVSKGVPGPHNHWAALVGEQFKWSVLEMRRPCQARARRHVIGVRSVIVRKSIRAAGKLRGKKRKLIGCFCRVSHLSPSLAQILRPVDLNTVTFIGRCLDGIVNTVGERRLGLTFQLSCVKKSHSWSPKFRMKGEPAGSLFP